MAYVRRSSSPATRRWPSVAVGTSVAVTVMSAGYVLSVAGQAVAFIPNEIGVSMLYNERVTR